METSICGFGSSSFSRVCADGGAVQKPDKEIHAPHPNYTATPLVSEQCRGWHCKTLHVQPAGLAESIIGKLR